MISVVFMTLDHRQKYLDNLRGVISVVVYPIQAAADLPFTLGDWLSENLTSRSTLLQENIQLRAQRSLLKAQLLKLSSLEAENIRLRELLQSAKKIREEILVAELLSVDLDPFKRQVILNKGSLDNIREGQPLLDADGMMGQVIQVNPLNSIALLITDPSHAIPVQVNRTGLRAIAVGTGSSMELDLPHIPITSDIQEGDLLITSGLGGRFPPDYPVATVTSVERVYSQPYSVVRAKPTAHLSHNREVLLAKVRTAPDVGDGE